MSWGTREPLQSTRGVWRNNGNNKSKPPKHNGEVMLIFLLWMSTKTMQPCEANIQLFQDICCFLAIENALRTETGRIRKATFDVTILGPLDEVFFHGIAPKKIHQAGSPRESLLNINWNWPRNPFCKWLSCSMVHIWNLTNPLMMAEELHWCTQTLGQFSMLDSLLWFVFVPCVAARPFVPAALHRLPAP